MKRNLEIHVEPDTEAMANRFIAAWHRAERGEAVDEAHLSFESWEALRNVLTSRRLAILRHLHRHPGQTATDLAAALSLDAEQVQADIDALLAAGLLGWHEDGLHADYDEIRTRIAM